MWVNSGQDFSALDFTATLLVEISSSATLQFTMGGIDGLLLGVLHVILETDSCLSQWFELEFVIIEKSILKLLNAQEINSPPNVAWLDR